MNNDEFEEQRNSEIRNKLDELATQGTFRRKVSVDASEATPVWDPVTGLFQESDEQFRQRIKAAANQSSIPEKDENKFTNTYWAVVEKTTFRFGPNTGRKLEFTHNCSTREIAEAYARRASADLERRGHDFEIMIYEVSASWTLRSKIFHTRERR